MVFNKNFLNWSGGEINRKFSSADPIFVAFGVITLSGAFFPWMKGAEGLDFLRPDLLHAMSLSLILFWSFLKILVELDEAFYVVAINPSLTALISWSALSLSWLAAPSVLGTMAAGLITASFFALAITLIRQKRSLLPSLGISAAIVIFSSIVHMILVDGIEGLKGVFSNRNLLARFCVFVILLSIHMTYLAIRKEKLILALLWASLLISSAYTVFVINAFTAFISLSLAASFVFYFWVSNKRPESSWILLICLSVFAIACFFGSDNLAKMVGESQSLNTRILHWQLMLHQDIVSPWIGAGLGGFWARDGGPWATLSFPVDLMHAHNGFVEIWLDLGLIGLVLTFLVCTVAVVRAFIRRNNTSYLGLALGGALLGYNLTESSILPTTSANLLFWVLFLILVVNSASARNDTTH